MKNCNSNCCYRVSQKSQKIAAKIAKKYAVHNYIYSGIEWHQKLIQNYKPCDSFGAHNHIPPSVRCLNHLHKFVNLWCPQLKNYPKKII